MFLHSAAGLHGHEYSSRPSPPPGRNAPRRNPLLRSSFAGPMNRASTYAYADSRSPSPTAAKSTAAAKHLRRPVSEFIPRKTPEPAVRFQEPEHEVEITSPKTEAMSEDNLSVDVSDSDASRAASSARRVRRRTPRISTKYLLAQPAPTLSKKQRLIHIRPRLLLQLHQLSDGSRPRPVIDVYPSSVIANLALAAPLLKRFPRLARIKRELSIHDIMLVRSEDYGTPVLESDKESEEENINKRDLVAILSPLVREDQVEIVLTDGTVWRAQPRKSSAGETTAYDFTTVDLLGCVKTSRWVRRQVVTKSVPGTPTSLTPATPVSSTSNDYKFTFSIIDPSYRRHPVMATLTQSSLDIPATYTTVSQSSGRCPPTSSSFTSSSPPDDDSAPIERRILPVEESENSFIQVSAMYVALWHGWVPHFNSKLVSPTTCTSTIGPSPKKQDALGHQRTRSYSTGPDATSSTASLVDPSCRRRCPTSFRDPGLPASGALPRRATSSGAAFMSRRKAKLQTQSEANSETESVGGKSRRPLSEDWNGSSTNLSRQSSVMSKTEPQRFGNIQEQLRSPVSTPPRLAPNPAHALTTNDGYFPEYPMRIRNPDENTPIVNCGPSVEPNPLFQRLEHLDAEVDAARGRHNRWRSVSNWFTKLRAH